MDELARLKESIVCHAGEGVARTALPGVSVICSSKTTEPSRDMAEPTLAVVAQGAKKTALNGRTFAYGAGQFLIVSVELPVLGHIVQASADEPFLDRAAVELGADEAVAGRPGDPCFHTTASIRKNREHRLAQRGNQATFIGRAVAACGDPADSGCGPAC